MKLVLSAAVLLSVLCFSHAEDKLKVTVYYETMCPDCINFFLRQLQPTYDELVDYVDLELVPFGKGTAEKDEDGEWHFECQHGPSECYGNKYHSCAIKIGTTAQALTFAACTEAQDEPASDQSFRVCAVKAGISYRDLRTCKVTIGDELLAAHAEKAKAVGYQVVPAIVFNDSYDQAASIIATASLKKLACSYLNGAPPQCRQQLDGDIVINL